MHDLGQTVATADRPAKALEAEINTAMQITSETDGIRTRLADIIARLAGDMPKEGANGAPRPVPEGMIGRLNQSHEETRAVLVGIGDLVGNIEALI